MNTLSESNQQAVCEMPPHFPKCLSQAVAWDTAVCEYANAHQLSIDDALEYLSECHNCGKSLDDNYDGIGHRYCSERCQYYCEDFHYTCFREGNCRQQHRCQEATANHRHSILTISIHPFEAFEFSALPEATQGNPLSTLRSPVGC